MSGKRTPQVPIGAAVVLVVTLLFLGIRFAVAWTSGALPLPWDLR